MSSMRHFAYNFLRRLWIDVGSFRGTGCVYFDPLMWWIIEQHEGEEHADADA